MNKLNEICTNIENNLLNRSHQPGGPLYKDICKQHALLCFKKKDDLKGIYSLSESHAPTYRIKTAYRYDKLTSTTTRTTTTTTADPNIRLTMNTDLVSFECPIKLELSVNKMLDLVAELPKEWTIVQITTRFNVNESTHDNISKIYTDPLYISVFNCGQKNVKPFYIEIPTPKSMNGDCIELCQEMRSVIDDNRNLLFNSFGKENWKNVTQKQKVQYTERKTMLNIRLKEILKQVEKSWLREWRCLLIGKFEDEIETIFKEIDNKLLDNNSGYDYTITRQYLLHKIITSAEYLSGNELLKALQFCIPDVKELRTEILNDILTLSNKHKFKNMKRYPVVLIIDEKLDCFPWEMLDVLNDHPVTRMPSLHFAYALYKEHENTIIDGFKQVKSIDGAFIINPGLDLKKMEKRLSDFFKYWIPQWSGIIGEKPTSEEFIGFLTDKDIFVYNGHGNGTQFCSAYKIQQMRVNSVVLLFGCSSVRMIPMGPFVEMYDQFHNYLIACSPCVVGMLWEVTDFDTDVLSTSILSTWIPSKAEKHWRHINKLVFWEGSKSSTTKQQQQPETKKQNIPEWEPELLRAINIARKEPIQFITNCALVARGLPVKLVIK